MSQDINVIEFDESKVEFEELSEKEAKQFKGLLTKFIKSYSQKDNTVSDKEWLKRQFKEELSDISDMEAEKLSSDTIDAIAVYDKNYASLNAASAKGQSKESWFAEKTAEASAGLSVIDYGNYLNTIDTAITNGNAQMLRTVTAQSGDISQCLNLDGFIAEQHHVNTFNMNAALERSQFRAEVCVPPDGSTYGKNSFDIKVLDRAGNRIQQYQVKYGKDASATIDYLKGGNYNNQRYLVPSGQITEVKNAYPNRTVVDVIGGRDGITTKSNPLTKAEAKELQLKAQLENCSPSNDWNNFNSKELALNLGKNAALSGMGAAALTTGFALASQVLKGEKIDADATVELALKTGADAGIKAATAGAIKVGSEKGIIGLIPKGTPAGIIANIACVSIENIKILGKVAKGELTVSQGLDRMGRTTTSMVYGLGWAATGMGIGMAALSWIPIVGPVVGGLAGGMISYMAGSKIGSAIYSGLKAVGAGAKNALKSTWNGIKSIGSKIKSFIFG